MNPTAELRVGRLADGYVLQVHGRASMRESPAVHSFAREALAENGNRLVVDLSRCDSIDSTFQGCLLSLARRFGQAPAGRFQIADPSPESRRLLTAARLLPLLPLVETAPLPIEIGRAHV